MKKYCLFYLVGFCFFTTKAQEPIIIETENSSLVYVVENEKLRQVYFGDKLQGTQLGQTNPLSFAAYSTFGTDEVNEVALRATHNDGNTSTELVVDSVKTLALSDHIKQTRIQLRDHYYPFRVDLVFNAYYQEDLIESWAEISHQEKGTVTLYNFASSQLSFKASSYWLEQLHGDWANEMNLTESVLTEGIKIIDSKLGVRATQYATPSFLLTLDQPSQEKSGQTVGASLAWPGSFQLAFEVNQKHELRILSGINPFASQYILDKDKVFKTPALLISYSNKGKGQLSRNFHDWARKYGVRDGDKSRLTLLNNWEATYFSFDEEKLTQIIRDAASLDLELFLLDDGWFGNKYPRNNDRAGLGDWQVNKKKLPDGIGYLVQKATKNGVKLGIWIEPEMVNPKSELYETHPDWVIGQPHRPEILSRNQLILDLSNPQVQEFVFQSVDDLLGSNPGIAYLKWDCNRFIQNGGSSFLSAERQSHLQIEYARGLLKIFEKVKNAYPEVQLMLCSGGGGRMEYGSLPFFHEFWPSDNTDAVQRIFIQWGGSIFFPAMASCNHVSVVPNHQSGRVTPLKFRFDVAMMGKMGMDLQPNQMNTEDFEFSKKAIATYKQIREVIYYGDLFRLESPYQNNRASLVYVNKDKSRAILFAYLIHRHVGEFYPPLKLDGLDPEKNYHLKELNLERNNSSRLAWNEKVIPGRILSQEGIHLPLYREFESLVLEIEEVK